MREMTDRPVAFRHRKGLNQKRGFFLLALVILSCAAFSLWPKQSRSFKEFKVDEDTRVTGTLSMPDRSGQAKIFFANQVSYQGGLKKGRFSGPGTLTYPDGRKLEADFQEGVMSQGRMTLKDGQEWKQEGDGSWALLKK